MRRGGLTGKRIVLTGATSGIGWYLTRQLIGEGACLVVTGRRMERLSALRKSLGNPDRLITVEGDLCQGETRHRLIKAALEHFGGIDTLVNNAGVGAIGSFAQSDSSRLRQLFEVDFFAALELTRLAIPYLKVGQRPMICNVTSVLAYRGVPLKSEYCAAKFALRGWSESLRVELMDSGINVVTVAPSTTRSEFFDALEDPTGRGSQNLRWAQSAQQVAHRIVRTLKSGRREAVLSLGGKALVCFSYWLPGMCDRLLNRFAK